MNGGGRVEETVGRIRDVGGEELEEFSGQPTGVDAVFLVEMDVELSFEVLWALLDRFEYSLINTPTMQTTEGDTTDLLSQRVESRFKQVRSSNDNEARSVPRPRIFAPSDPRKDLFTNILDFTTKRLFPGLIPNSQINRASPQRNGLV